MLTKYINKNYYIIVYTNNNGDNMAIEIFNMDCMDLMNRCRDKEFDLAIVDPPYGRGEHGGTNRNHGVKQKNGAVMQCKDGRYEKKDWDNIPPPIEYFSELIRVSANQIIWGINYFPINLPGGRIVWDKCNDGSDQSDAEIAYNSTNQRVDIVRYLWRGMMQGESIGSARQQGNKKLNEKRIHPTQKPIKLYQWMYSKYAEKGMRILDTHLGSAGNAIVAHYFGCDFTGTEKDKDYFNSGKDRFHNMTRQMSLF